MVKVNSDEQLIAQIFDSRSESVVWFNPVLSYSSDEDSVEDFEVRYCNLAAAKILGVSPSEVTGARLKSTGLLDEMSRKLMFDQCFEIYMTGQSIDFTYFSPGFDRYFNVQRSKVQNGVLSITRDCTKEIKAKHKHEELEKKYQEILDTSADGVLVLEAIREENNIADFKITYCNKCGFELGKLPSDAVGKTVYEVLPYMKEHEQLELYKQVIETGIPARFETSFKTPDGKDYGWFMVSLTKLGNAVVSRFSDISQRKQHEQQIEEQKEELRSIFNASQNAIAALEAVRDETDAIVDFRYLKINSVFCKITRKTAEEIEGSLMLDLFPGVRIAGIFDFYKKVIETGKTAGMQTYYHGEDFDNWFDICAVKRGKNGLVLTLTDVTSWKRTLNEIEQQKKLLDNILTQSPSGISVLEVIRDHKGQVIDFRNLLLNDAAALNTGVSKEMLLTKTNAEIDPNFLNSPTFNMFVSTLQSGQPCFMQYHNEQTKKWIEGAVSKMDEERLICVFTDITPAKEIQLKIEQSSEKLRTVINTSQAGFFLCTPVLNKDGEITDFRFTMVNQVLASFAGKDPKELVGEVASDSFVKYKNNGLFERFRQTYITGTRQQFDIHYIGETTEVWANVMATRLGDELLGSFTDFTPIKQLQLELEKSVEELKRVNANLEEFTYAASHDLQEPLRKIDFFAEQLRKDFAPYLKDESQRKLDKMQAATLRMRTLIKDLLDYSQLSVRPDVYKEVNLSDILQQVMHDLEATISETGAVVTTNLLPQINGDERQIRQMFQNLISNAIKYRKPGSIPQISIHSKIITHSDPVFPVTEELRNGAYCLIEISDNGIGFDQANAEKIFQVFQRLHGRAEYEGTGVGLAIVQKVVTNHKGYITAQGEPGKGATFRVMLPV
jgi:signal transduction histidine kinase